MLVVAHEQAGRVFDIFLGNDEIEFLKFRVSYLSPVVDFHFLGESRTTFTGKPKPLYFGDREDALRSEFPTLQIVEIPIFAENNEISAIERENLQRDWLVKYVCQLASPESTVFLSDIDEIPSRDQVESAVASALDGQIMSVPMYFSYRHINYLRDPDPRSWAFTKVWRGGYPGDSVRFRDFPHLGSDEPGRHLSYVGFGSDSLENKLSSFSHAEYNQAHMASDQVLSFCNAFGIDHLARIGEGFGLLSFQALGKLGSVGMAAAKFNPSWVAPRITVSRFRRIVASVILNRYRIDPNPALLAHAWSPVFSLRWTKYLFYALGHWCLNFIYRLKSGRA